jgi:hypothetical protein
VLRIELCEGMSRSTYHKCGKSFCMLSVVIPWETTQQLLIGTDSENIDYVSSFCFTESKLHCEYKNLEDLEY